MSSRGFMSLRVVSRLFAWFHVSSRGFVSSSGFMSLRVVLCLCMVSWFDGFASSCRFDIFVLLSDQSRCFQNFALFSELTRRPRGGGASDLHSQSVTHIPESISIF